MCCRRVPFWFLCVFVVLPFSGTLACARPGPYCLVFPLCFPCAPVVLPLCSPCAPVVKYILSNVICNPYQTQKKIAPGSEKKRFGGVGASVSCPTPTATADTATGKGACPPCRRHPVAEPVPEAAFQSKRLPTCLSTQKTASQPALLGEEQGDLGGGGGRTGLTWAHAGCARRGPVHEAPTDRRPPPPRCSSTGDVQV
jgi:hypothetical protein